MSVSIEVKDQRDRFDAIMAAFADSPGASVKFGSVGSAAGALHVPNDGGPAELPVATILAFQEYGTARIPERSLVRAWTDGHHRELGDAFKTGVLRQLAAQGSTTATLELVGKVAREGMTRRLWSRIPPPLAAATLANPNRDPRGIPLVDTQQIMDSLGAEVEL